MTYIQIGALQVQCPFFLYLYLISRFARRRGCAPSTPRCAALASPFPLKNSSQQRGDRSARRFLSFLGCPFRIRAPSIPIPPYLQSRKINYSPLRNKSKFNSAEGRELGKRERERENLRERGDRSAATTPLFLGLSLSHSYSAQCEGRTPRGKGETRFTRIPPFPLRFSPRAPLS